LSYIFKNRFHKNLIIKKRVGFVGFRDKCSIASSRINATKLKDDNRLIRNNLSGRIIKKYADTAGGKRNLKKKFPLAHVNNFDGSSYDENTGNKEQKIIDWLKKC